MISDLEKQVMQFRALDELWYGKLRSSGLYDDYKLLANSFRRARGHKHDESLIDDMIIIQRRNNDVIKADIFNDDKASEKKENGDFTYSGIGKTVGLKTYVKLCGYNDFIIYDFFYALKVQKRSLKEAKTLMYARYGAKL